jgi:hypothetical protein
VWPERQRERERERERERKRDQHAQLSGGRCPSKESRLRVIREAITVLPLALEAA